MAIELIDDGTLDTVLRCSECNEEMRYSTPMDAYDETDGPCEHGVKSGGDGCSDCRDAWIAELITECSDEHVCAVDEDDEPNGPQDDDLTTSDHISFYYHGGHKAFHLQETSKGTFRINAHPRRHVPGEYATVERAIRAFMQAEQYWPNCWFISDHGNAHLMDLNRA
jgi:hypothetical protein